MLRCRDRFFTFLVLDNAILSILVKYVDMQFFYPTTDKTLDELLDVQVEL